MRRSERIALISKTLSGNPNKFLFPEPLRSVAWGSQVFYKRRFRHYKKCIQSFGSRGTYHITRSSGRRSLSHQEVCKADQCFFRRSLQYLTRPKRIIPGGYLYMTDIIFSPEYSGTIGEIFAQLFIDDEPTHVLTVETKGIPIALMTARALNVPMVVARRGQPGNRGAFCWHKLRIRVRNKRFTTCLWQSELCRKTPGSSLWMIL